MKKRLIASVLTGTLLATLAPVVNAAVALDRTRVVYPGNEKSISLSISNQNPKLPYLAQAWLESEEGTKLTGNAPLMVLPPVQRVEPNGKGQVKVQAMPGAAQLPQDRETLFYFNLREIPPKADKGNVLQIALQTRIKLFYRPTPLASAAANQSNAPWQEKLTMSKTGDSYLLNNPTPYYITIIGASNKKGGESVKGFQAVMIAPNGSEKLSVPASSLGATPVLTYINDYGAQPELVYQCSGSSCKVDKGASK
ncbi:hypothetical protein AW879_05385 [Enterobacter cloacae]|nr:fimbria/pilus periplasmic chaperone [Enterobacter cloacae]AMJ69358.1 hypothetical protein AW879_05385 [Enterobacter cloacae]EJC0565546.1 fimbria/pilus periplasmic chaperone [Enterobacter cloacae]